MKGENVVSQSRHWYAMTYFLQFFLKNKTMKGENILSQSRHWNVMKVFPQFVLKNKINEGRKHFITIQALECQEKIFSIFSEAS